MKTTKNLLFYVLYLFLGNVSGVVPLVAGWRETKLKCTIGLFGVGWGNCSLWFFFSFFKLYQSEYHCYSKCLALFCLEALDLQRQLSLTPAGQRASQPASQSMGESEWGGEGECPLSASLLWSSGCQVGAPLPPWAPLDPPSVWQHSSSSKTGQSQPAATHSNSNGGPLPPNPAVVLPSLPSLSSLTQRSL